MISPSANELAKDIDEITCQNMHVLCLAFFYVIETHLIVIKNRTLTTRPLYHILINYLFTRNISVNVLRLTKCTTDD